MNDPNREKEPRKTPKRTPADPPKAGRFGALFDEEMKAEFLDRFGELAESAGGLESVGGGLESLTGGLDSLRHGVDTAREALESPDPDHEVDPGLEAIILRFGRPAYFVRDNSFQTEGTPSTSQVMDQLVDGARSTIETAIPSVGRINLRNHSMGWVGTGWVIEPNVVVTNRHVARAFAEADGDGFAFVQSHDGRYAKAELDTLREHESGEESVFKMKEVLWIEPSKKGHHDVAFLSIEPEGEDDQPQPPRITLMSDEEFVDVTDRWLAVIGYPAYSIYNNAQDQQRIFDGVFDVKRLQPGKVKHVNDAELKHDATTLGGNSGSVVLDLELGKAMALHFGGYEGKTNFAVPAPVVRRLLEEKVLK